MTAKDKLLDASLALVREKGFAGATVDELCARAGVTKGAFFHYFKSKEALGVAAAEHWSQVTSELFAAAPYHQFDDPLERVLGYVDLRRQLLEGALPEITCVVGTMVQETYQQHPEIRDACARSIFGHVETLEGDITAAIEVYGQRGTWTPKSLAVHTQAVLQGAFIVAKASDDVELARQSVDHLRHYIELLFGAEQQQAAA